MVVINRPAQYQCHVRELLTTLGDDILFRYVVRDDCISEYFTGYKYAVPFDSVKAKPKTVSKQQIKKAKELLEALKNGAVVEEQ